ncbi:MAG: TolC family protein, partial [Deltaproteobacteria bacterium]|nr:TolC family protein [Deltaproteobacteria bacterium]
LDAHLPELNENASLDDYVLYAMLNNPGLRAAFDRWKAALEKMAPARTLPDPRFTYANYIKEVETRVGAQEHKFGLAQTFPWFGKLDLRGEMVLQAAQAEHQRYEAAKLDLIFRVKNIYYEYGYLAQAINIAKDNVTLLTHFESVARAKYRGGAGLQSAVIKVQVELGKLEDRLRSLQDLTRPIVAKLNFFLNRPSHLPLPLPKALPAEKHDVADKELFSLLRAENPSLKVLDFMAAKEDFAIKLAEKNFFPDMTLGVDYIDTSSRSDMDPKDNGKDPVIAKLSINVPIWHQKYNAIGKEAKARRRAFLRDRKEKENLLIADLEMALYQLRDADRKINLYGDTLLPKAEQNVKINLLAFTSEKASFLDLIDSQRILLGFQLERKRALADRAQKMAEIEMLTGGDIERKTAGPEGQESEK